VKVGIKFENLKMGQFEDELIWDIKKRQQNDTAAVF